MVGISLECFKGRAQRAPFQPGDRGIVDEIALPQFRERNAVHGARLKSRDAFDVDIERIEKQPAVGRIGAAVIGPIVEQCMQRIEADAIRAQLSRQFDQPFEIAEVADSPVAGRPDAVELDRQQPAAVEIAAECPGRGDDQRHIFRIAGGIDQLQPVVALRQIRRPNDDGLSGFAPRDNLKIRNDFPAQRERGGGLERGPPRKARPDDHNPVEKAVRRRRREGVDNELQRGLARHAVVTESVDKTGLNPQIVGFGEKVHSARGLHATAEAVAKYSRCRNRIAVFNSKAAPAFPGNQCPARGFLYRSAASPFPQSKRGVVSMSMASP